MKSELTAPAGRGLRRLTRFCKQKSVIQHRRISIITTTTTTPLRPERCGKSFTITGFQDSRTQGLKEPFLEGKKGANVPLTSR